MDSTNTQKRRIMHSLYFNYGTMGSSKSAQALMVKFNYEHKGMTVMLVKPALDNRGDVDRPKVRSRIGLVADCLTITPEQSFLDLFESYKTEHGCDCIIVDEAQFCTAAHIDQLKQLTKFVPVLCYGLLTDFTNKLFEGSKRLVELADSLREIKSVCRCGRKSTVNARFVNGKCVDDGPVVLIGGDESYVNMCYWCWQDELKKNK